MQTNKIGKYIIHEDNNPQNRITNVNAVSENNIISIKWDFPKDPNYKLAVIFRTCDTVLSLRELLMSNSESTTLVKNIQTDFTYRLKSDAGFKIYPAAFGEGDEINIIDQQTGNFTPVFSKLVKVTYNIVYRQILLTNLKSAHISISVSEPISKDELYFKKLRGNREIAKYPLDAAAVKSAKISSKAIIRSDEIIKICSKSTSGKIELTETLKI